MTVGVVVNNKCLDPLVSSDNYFSAIPPSLSANTITYFYKTTWGAWKVKKVNMKNGLVSYNVRANPPTFPTCLREQSFLDGAAFGTLLGTSMVAIGIWGIMRRAV